MEPGKDRSRHEENPYGAWTWVAGFAFGALVIWLMFVLATGFS